MAKKTSGPEVPPLDEPNSASDELDDLTSLIAPELKIDPLSDGDNSDDCCADDAVAVAHPNGYGAARTPEFINTDFTRPLILPPPVSAKRMAGNMDGKAGQSSLTSAQPINLSATPSMTPINLSACQPINLSVSQPVSLATSQAVNQSTGPINLAAGQPINLSTAQPIGFNSAGQAINPSTGQPINTSFTNLQNLGNVNLHLTGGQRVLTPGQAPVGLNSNLGKAFGTSVSTLPTQATLVNVNQNGAALFGQPVLLSMAACRQPLTGARFVTQPGVGSGVIMPLQQASGLLQPGTTIQRAQIINTNQLPKTIQPKPAGMVSVGTTLPTSTIVGGKLVTAINTTLPSNVVSMATAGTTFSPLSSVGIPFNLQTSPTANIQAFSPTSPIAMPQLINLSPISPLPQIPLSNLSSPLKDVGKGDTSQIPVIQSPTCVNLSQSSLLLSPLSTNLSPVSANRMPVSNDKKTVAMTTTSSSKISIPSSASDKLAACSPSKTVTSVPMAVNYGITIPLNTDTNVPVNHPLALPVAGVSRNLSPRSGGTSRPHSRGSASPASSDKSVPLSMRPPSYGSSPSVCRSLSPAENFSTEPLVPKTYPGCVVTTAAVTMTSPCVVTMSGLTSDKTVADRLAPFSSVDLPCLPPSTEDENIISAIDRKQKKKIAKQNEFAKKLERKNEEAKQEIIKKYNKEKKPAVIEEDVEEPEFVWEEYIEQTGSSAVPHTSFHHIECSLQSGVEKGMKVEVKVTQGGGGMEEMEVQDTYWVALIVMTAGPLIRLRYEGYKDHGGADFWCDILSADIHPLGWCQQNGKKLQPPEALKERLGDWSSSLATSLVGARTLPHMDGMGMTPVDQIKPGMRLEVRHELKPQYIWPVYVIENVGGRLLLRYEGTESAHLDFWLFYLHYRIHPADWAKQNDYLYRPPQEIESEHTKEEWDSILVTALEEATKNPFPANMLKDQDVIPEHEFQVGWKLEALNISNRTEIAPATVVDVPDKYFFIVELDDTTDDPLREKIQMCCHSSSPEIFPIEWCLSKGMKLTYPIGWERSEFDWSDYLKDCNAAAAPDDAFTLMEVETEFERGFKLEAVNPEQPGQICVATITRITDHLMWIHLDGAPCIRPNHIVPMMSHDIMPVGWCESNDYPLRPPREVGWKRSRKNAIGKAVNQISGEDFSAFLQIPPGVTGYDKEEWCPKIYFNHKCFSGPFLSKGRIAELPKCVGPGPIHLVLEGVLTMLINVAYKSSRVLRELQMEGPANPNMYQQTLKAKYKGKSYRAVVEICKSSDRIEAFCRQVCIKLECCPYLFSPHFIKDNCPEKCSQLTKTKYTYYYGKKKKRKIGRPPGGHTNLENGPRKPGKRRKRRKGNFLNRKKTESVDSDDGNNGNQDEANGGEEDEESVSSEQTNGGQMDEESNDGDTDYQPERKKRKYTHHIPPPSMIKTRGAKLPKFTFERRTHKKIPLPPAKPPSPVIKCTSPPQYRRDDIEKLPTNPLRWSIAKVIEFIKTTDCAHLAYMFREQEIDGQALLLMTLPTVQEHLDLKLGPAIKLCHHIERVKIAFFEQYAK